ncbi:hypothetical protein D7X32_28630 [Corallococcus carmarthensis]|uniref:Uncharacterized protein n=1 Tax=Corallococcus carmarthensis TaxID=2316728 RepID=A0A3A8JUZ2_9BACT|nr:hypothetical protein D7X32_28630 [Corallococcus carmarthensis]
MVEVPPLWAIVTESRSHAVERMACGTVARALLGEDFAGLLISDRWSGSAWHDAGPRQRRRFPR